jgi:hypothetical protein
MNNMWTIQVEEDEDGNTILPFPEDMLEKMDWRAGDTLDFHMNYDESCSIVNLSREERQRALHQA